MLDGWVEFLGGKRKERGYVSRVDPQQQLFARSCPPFFNHTCSLTLLGLVEKNAWHMFEETIISQPTRRQIKIRSADYLKTIYPPP